MKPSDPSRRLALIVFCAGILCACTEFLDVSPDPIDSGPQDTDSSDQDDTGSDTAIPDVYIGSCMREPTEPSGARENCSEFFGTEWEEGIDVSECNCDLPGYETCTWSQGEDCSTLGRIGTCTCEHAEGELELIYYFSPTSATTADKLCSEVAAYCTWRNTLSTES